LARIKKTLSNWLNAKHILIIQNEENFSEKATFKFTYAKFIFFAFVLFVLIMLISFYLVNTLLAQWFDPRYAEQQTRIELVEMKRSLDSMDTQLAYRDDYIQNIKRILSGNVSDESPEPEEFDKNELQDVESILSVDSAFKAEFERAGNSLLSELEENSELRQIYFFSPISGYISAAYDPKNEHFGIDIVSKKDEPVKCIADGTVIFVGWTQNDGNVIMVQHTENLVSVYKHNSSLTKKLGDIVTAGEIVSIIGNTGELTDGAHLHFELWYQGAPVNPEEFVSF
jgi:murein DD-endopeptidase MepM/ murein hydrolase activator NlpD